MFINAVVVSRYIKCYTVYRFNLHTNVTMPEVNEMIDDDKREKDRQREQWRQIQRAPTERIKEKATSIISLLPLFNYVYCCFFLHDAPKFEDVQVICEFFGLIAALMFTVVGVIPLSVSYEQLSNADKRYFNGNETLRKAFGMNTPTQGIEVGIYGCIIDDERDRRLSVNCAYYCLMAMCLFTMALVITFFTASAASAFDLGVVELKTRRRMRRDVEEEEAKMICYQRAFRFWKWARWTSLLTLILLFYGMLYSYDVVQELIMIVYPNRYFENLCIEQGWVRSDGLARDIFQSDASVTYVNGSFIEMPKFSDQVENIKENPIIYTTYLNYYMFFPITLGVLLILGYGGAYTLWMETKEFFTATNPYQKEMKSLAAAEGGNAVPGMYDNPIYKATTNA
eukprot:m.9948 g.9948  ORF g.9948 m.9948 type:complete len:397 (+) comp4171_c0_seq1:1-1191(+)